MTMRTSRLRRAVYLLIVALIMGAPVWGCAHEDLGPWEQPEIPVSDEWPEWTKENVTVEVHVSDIRTHAVELTFNEVMYKETVEVEMWDDRGRWFEPISVSWDDAVRVLTLAGDMRFCRTYGLRVLAGARNFQQSELEADFIAEIPMGPNPYDVDRDGGCRAEAAVSPVFLGELDGMIMAGDDIVGASGTMELLPWGFDTPYQWYVDGSLLFAGAGRIAVVPDLAGAGTGGAARLYWLDRADPQTGVDVSYYELHLWHSYDPADEGPTSVYTHEIKNTGEELIGPFDAGDINGDGAHEIMVAGQVSTSARNLLQRIFVIEGPHFPGAGAELSEAASVDRLIGSLDGVVRPYVSVGDIDGDGMDDLAAVSYSVSDQGVTSYWQVKMAHGDPDLRDVFNGSTDGRVRGALGRDITGVEGADVDGDGAADLIVADARRIYVNGEVKLRSPRVKILMGGRRFTDLHVEQADVEISYIMGRPDYYVDSFQVRNLGDINGDGADDIAVGIVQEDAWGNARASDVTVVLGRYSWTSDYNIMPVMGYDPVFALRVVPGWGEILRVKGGLVDPRVGDLDNDGFYDLMLPAEGVYGRKLLLFWGDDSFRIGQGRIVGPEDADATWLIRD